jgi:hypothetical protein
MVQEHRDLKIKHNSKICEIQQQIEHYKKFLQDCDKTNNCNEKIYKTIQERLNILQSFKF